MFFAKKPSVIYLQTDACILYTNSNPNGDTFTFPQEVGKNTTIKNGDEFCEHFKTFLIQNSLKSSSAILVLSSDLFTQKEITKKDVEEQKKEVEEFIKSTKIPEEALNKETFELDNVLYVMALNKSFYTSFVNSLNTIGFSISSVIPISLFRDINDTKIKKNGISTKELKEILNNPKLIKDASIFKEEINLETPSQLPATPKKSFLSLTYIGIAGCSVVIVASLIFLIQSGAVSQIQNSLIPKPTPTLTPTPSPTPIAFEEDKSKLKVKIFNGTGITGQAGKVKSAITKLDYTDIQTGNADNQENTETMVTVSNKVSPEYTDEIVKSLEDLFETVSKKSEDGEFDITILTGTEK